MTQPGIEPPYTHTHYHGNIAKFCFYGKMRLSYAMDSSNGVEIYGRRVLKKEKTPYLIMNRIFNFEEQNILSEKLIGVQHARNCVKDRH